MTSSTQGISELRQRMIEDMRIRKLEPKTQSGYIRAVRHFTIWFGRSPDQAVAEDLRLFQLHLVDQGVSPITINATQTWLRIFFDITLDRPEVTGKMRPVRVAQRLPVVLSREEATRLIDATYMRALRHRPYAPGAHPGARASTGARTSQRGRSPRHSPMNDRPLRHRSPPPSYLGSRLTQNRPCAIVISCPHVKYPRLYLGSGSASRVAYLRNAQRWRFIPQVFHC